LEKQKATKSGSSRKKETIKNLFATDDSTIDQTNDERTPEYLKFERELSTELHKCTQHSDRTCKIDKNNYHRSVSEQQFRAWIEAYVSLLFIYKITVIHMDVA